MKTIITTVGTSLFENYMNSEVEDRFEDEDLSYTDISDAFKELKDNRGEAREYNKNGSNEKWIRNTIKDKWLKGITKDENSEWNFRKGVNEYACAEIQSLLKIIEGNADKISIILMASDTVLSYLASIVIKDSIIDQLNGKISKNMIRIEIIENYNFGQKKIDTDTVFQNLIRKLNSITAYKQLKPLLGRLKKNKAKDYQNKIDNPNISNELKKVIIEIKEKAHSKPKGENWIDFFKEEIIKSESEFIINVTGGYKGIIPYLTVIAQLWGIQMFYLFEDSETPVTINKLPVQFDPSLIEQLYPYLNDAFLKNLNSIKKNQMAKEHLLTYKLVREIPSGLLDITAFGKIFSHYVALKDPNDKSVFGFFAEYKFYEFFLEYQYLGMPWVKHSKTFFDNTGQKEHEIDLQISSIKDDGNTALSKGDFILVEIKSFYRVIVDIEKIIEDTKKRITFYQNKFGKKPKEYILAFYKNDFNEVSMLQSEIKKFLNEATSEGTITKVIYTDIKITDNQKSDTNIYKKFAGKELQKSELIDFSSGKPLIL